MKKGNWKKYGIEFLSIFIAVIAAFALNNWNDNRRDRIFSLATLLLLSYSCGMKTAQEAGLSFSTQASKLPDSLQWQEIGFAKELMNQKEMMVVISGGKECYYNIVGDHLGQGYHQFIFAGERYTGYVY